MNFIWLEDFLALAASGNFSRAAQERFSSQPAFSRRIRLLEEWMGTALVDRSTQPARLTEAGEWFHGIAENMVAQIARLPGHAKQVAQTQSITLRIASTHALSFVFLPKWLRNLDSVIPIERVELMSDVLSRCEVLMQQGKVHFVISHANLKAPSSLDSEEYVGLSIGTDELIPVSQAASTGLPRHTLSIYNKKPAPILRYTEESGLGRIFEAVLGVRLKSVPTQLAFKAHLASVLRTMALDGRGIAWLPRSLVDEDIVSGRLVLASDDNWRVPLEIRLYRDQTMIGQAQQAFWRAATIGN
jgi:LysR family transcriptional regulator, hypochlorite-specific transcription factor HypT